MTLDADLQRLAGAAELPAALDAVEAGVWRCAAVQARAAEAGGRRRIAGVAAIAAVTLAGAAGMQAAAHNQAARPSELTVLASPDGGLGGLGAAVAQ